MQAGVAAVLSILRSSAVVVDESDHVLKASAPAYAFGLVRGDTVVVPELLDLVAQVRRDGQIRERDIDLPAPDGGFSPHPHRARRPARRPAGAGPRRGPHPREARRGGAPRLRRQRQPRAQDPGRRDPAARRGRHRRLRRPRGRAALRRPDAHRERPALQARAADHRALPAAGQRPARDPGHGRPRRRSRRPRSTPAPWRRPPRTSPSTRAASPAWRSSAPRSRSARRSATSSPTPSPTPATGSRVVVTTRSEGDEGADLGRRPGHRHPGRGHRPHLRAVLPRRPRAAPLDRRHGPRPLDRQARRGHPRRRHLGLVGPGPGLDLHPHPPPQRRARPGLGTDHHPGRGRRTRATRERPPKPRHAEHSRRHRR